MSKFWVTDNFHYYLAKQIFDLSADTFKLALVTSALASTEDAWAADTAYTVGDVVIPTTRNGYRYKCTVAGTSHAATEPTWPTDAGTVTDNEVTWAYYNGDLCNLSIWGDVSGSEVTNGDGYTTGGEALTTLSLSVDGPVTTWDADDITFSALTKTFRTGWLYKVGTEGAIVNPLFGYILFDEDYADKEIDGIDFWVQLSSSGIYTFTNGTV